MSETIVTKGRTILPSKPYSGTVQQGKATRKTPVNIAEIIEQVLAISPLIGSVNIIDRTKVIEILERYR